MKTKRLTSLRRIGEQQYSLEVAANPQNACEFKDIFGALKSHGFIFNLIKPDEIRASLTSDYGTIMSIALLLEANGWEW